MPQTKKQESKLFELICDRLAEQNAEAVLADGFEEALIGIAEVFNKSIAMYDKRKCIEILMIRDKMSYETACEFFEFNTQGAYFGESTPAFVTVLAKK